MTVKNSWSALLADITRHNAGLHARREWIDLRFSAQWQEAGYPLLGIPYAPRDHGVEIMLGHQGSTELHLTRSVASAVDIDLLPPAPATGKCSGCRMAVRRRCSTWKRRNRALLRHATAQQRSDP